MHVVHKTPDGAPVFTPGSNLAEEMEGVVAKEGEKIVTKQFPGSFTGTDLEEYLKESGKKKVVLVGYMVSVELVGMRMKILIWIIGACLRFDYC